MRCIAFLFGFAFISHLFPQESSAIDSALLGTMASAPQSRGNLNSGELDHSCKRLRTAPWVREVRQAELEFSADECPSLERSLLSFAETAGSKCKNIYLESRTKPLQEIKEGVDEKKGWNFFRSLHLWPGDLSLSSLKMDSTMKLAACLTHAAAESVPASRADQAVIKDSVTAGWHTIAFYFTAKSFVMGGRWTSWNKLRKISWGTTLKKRFEDFERLRDEIEYFYQERLQEHQNEVIRLLSQQCDVDGAKQLLSHVKNVQIKHLADQRSRYSFARRMLYCHRVKSGSQWYDRMLDSYFLANARSAYQSECSAMSGLADTWEVFERGVPLLVKERQTVTQNYEQLREDYADSMAYGYYETADEKLVAIEQLSQQRCAIGFSSDSVIEDALSGGLSRLIDEKRNKLIEEGEGSSRLSYLVGDLRYFGPSRYLTAHFASPVAILAMLISGVFLFKASLFYLVRRKENSYRSTSRALIKKD